MKKISLLIFSYSLCFLFLFSCSEPQDFNQAKDLEVIPDLSGSIVYVETTEAIINSTSPVSITQNINFDAFTSSIFSDKVISGSVKFQLENTTSKNMQVQIDFLDASDVPLDSFLVTALAAPPETTSELEVAYGPPSGRNIAIIRNTSSIQLTFVNNSDNTSVSSLSNPKLIFKSSASFKLRLLE